MKTSPTTLLVALGLALCLAAAALASVHADAALASQFEAFKEQYGKVYASAHEEAHRFRVFKESLAMARLHADANPHATFGVTKFSDRTRDELDAMLGSGLEPITEADEAARRFVEVEGTAPSAVDWRQSGAVTSVRDQGKCNSCWAFAVMGNIEGIWKVAGNAITALSEQVLVSCDKTNFACEPSYTTRAYTWLVNTLGGKVPTLASYPYVSGNGYVPSCSMTGLRYGAAIRGYVHIPADEEKMATYLAANGPITALLDYNSFPYYKGGVVTSCYSTRVNHAVVLVGYNKASSPPYWIVKNSWGPNWGEEGYIRLEFGTNQCLLKGYAQSATL